MQAAEQDLNTVSGIGKGSDADTIAVSKALERARENGRAADVQLFHKMLQSSN